MTGHADFKLGVAKSRTLMSAHHYPIHSTGQELAPSIHHSVGVVIKRLPITANVSANRTVFENEIESFPMYFLHAPPGFRDSPMLSHAFSASGAIRRDIAVQAPARFHYGTARRAGASPSPGRNERRVFRVLRDIVLIAMAWAVFIGIMIQPAAQLVGLLACAIALIVGCGRRGTASTAAA
jgi:hypothetical protein